MLSPKEHYNKRLSDYLAVKLDWDMNLVNETKSLLRYALQKPQCFWYKHPDTEVEDQPTLIGYPVLRRVYTPPVIKCKKSRITNNAYRQNVEKSAANKGKDLNEIMILIMIAISCILF